MVNLIEELKKLKMNHLVIEGDCYFSCPMSGDCCNEDESGCNCGADEHNARLQKIINHLAEGVEG